MSSAFDFIQPRTLSVKKASVTHNGRAKTYERKVVIIVPIVSSDVEKTKDSRGELHSVR